MRFLIFSFLLTLGTFSVQASSQSCLQDVDASGTVDMNDVISVVMSMGQPCEEAPEVLAGGAPAPQTNPDNGCRHQAFTRITQPNDQCREGFVIRQTRSCTGVIIDMCVKCTKDPATASVEFGGGSNYSCEAATRRVNCYGVGRFRTETYCARVDGGSENPSPTP